MRTPKTPGYVYVLTNPAFPDHVKIGRTTNPKHRLASYNCGCPSGAYSMPVLLHVSHSIFVETETHKALGAKRASGEWFRTTAKVARAAILKANTAPRAGLLDMSEDEPVSEPEWMRQAILDTEAEEIQRRLPPQDPHETWADIERECAA